MTKEEALAIFAGGTCGPCDGTKLSPSSKGWWQCDECGTLFSDDVYSAIQSRDTAVIVWTPETAITRLDGEWSVRFVSSHGRIIGYRTHVSGSMVQLAVLNDADTTLEALAADYDAGKVEFDAPSLIIEHKACQHCGGLFVCSETCPETIARKAAAQSTWCKSVTGNSAIGDGWVCCQCRTFHGSLVVKQTTCRHCGHARCEPPKPN